MHPTHAVGGGEAGRCALSCSLDALEHTSRGQPMRRVRPTLGPPGRRTGTQRRAVVADGPGLAITLLRHRWTVRPKDAFASL